MFVNDFIISEYGAVVKRMMSDNYSDLLLIPLY
jgi:hypothetical protein